MKAATLGAAMIEREVALLLAEIEAAHRGWETRPGMLTTWHECLADLDAAAVFAAARSWRRTQAFGPSIADLRRGVARAAGLLAPSVDEAFAQALSRAPDSHPLVVRVRDAIGDEFAWRTGDRGFLLRDFTAFYTPAARNYDLDVAVSAPAGLGAGQSVKQLPEGVTDG